VHQVISARLGHRVLILGLLGSLLALAPLPSLTPAALATTGTITEFRPTNPPILQTASSDPLGITTGPDGNLWFTDAGENLGAGAPAPKNQIERYDPNTGALAQFPNGEHDTVSVAIATGSDGNLWSANEAAGSGNDIVRTTPSGVSTIYGIHNPPGATGVTGTTLSGPTGVVGGPDGKIWFTEYGAGAIGQIDPACPNPDGSKSNPCERDFPLPGGLANPGVTSTAVTEFPQAITSDPANGLVWVTVQNSKNIYGIDMNGHIAKTANIGLPELDGITMGPDGNVWYTQEHGTHGSGSVIGRVNPTSGLEIQPRFTVPDLGGGKIANPSAITAGPDGNLYFIDQGNNAIGQISVAGVIQLFTAGLSNNVFSPNVQPTGITVGPDHNIWFTENHVAGNPSAPGLGRLSIDKAVDFSPAPVAFGTVLPAQSKTLTVTAKNTTASPVTITNIKVTTPGANAGEFAISANTCMILLTAGASCTLQVTFTPTATGPRSATLQFTDTGFGSPHTVALTGIGQTSAPTFGPGNANFGNTPVGSVTKPVIFSLSNNTGVAVAVGSVTLGGANAGDFRILSDTCTNQTVGDNSSCSVSVAFAPSTLGTRSSNLTVVANGTALPSSSLSGTGVAPPPGSNPGNGYWEVASDGGIFTFGSATFLGSTGSIHLNKPIVGMARTFTGQGYWMVATDGGIFAFGDAKFFGSTGSIHLNQPIVGMAATPDGQGYWLVASDGGVFAFGSAKFFGSTGSIHLNKPIVGMTASPDGQGYWMVATDGGIFAFGTARFFGSTGAIHLNQPIVGMAATPDGQGYWLAATDGGIFAFGTAGFFGSTGAIHLNKPMVAIAATLDGAGYWMSATDGGIFNFGDAKFFGSTGSIHLNQPIVGMAAAT
jgi:streptogramin lyase/ribosomal protein L24E